MAHSSSAKIGCPRSTIFLKGSFVHFFGPCFDGDSGDSAWVQLLVFHMGLVFSQRIPFHFPGLRGKLVSASASLLAHRYRPQELAEHLRTSLSAADESEGGGLVKGTLTRLGEGPLARGPREAGSHLVTVEAQLVPTEERDIGAVDFGGVWDDFTSAFPGTEALVFSAAAGPSAGAPIALQLSHRPGEASED